MKENRGITYLYIRVSTERQSYERQISNFNAKGYELSYIENSKGDLIVESAQPNVKVFAEKFTGTKLHERKQLMELLKNLKEDDTLVIDSMSRLARSMKGLLDIIEIISKQKAGFISLKEDLDLSTATGKLMFNLIGAINQFERDITSERVKETLRQRQEAGITLGRPTEYDHEAIVRDYIGEDKPTYRELSKKYGITIGQISNIMKTFNVNTRTRKLEEA